MDEQAERGLADRTEFLREASSDEGRAIVIGAGPAGLAVGACLRRVGIRPVILEQADAVGAAWRRHYDRLHLHTDKASSGLPYLSFPSHYPRYPGRDQMVAYLESYADHFGLAPEFGRAVRRVYRSGRAWEVHTAEEKYRASHLVVATGRNSQPMIPEFAGKDCFGGEMIHSSAYRNGEPYRGKRVLVVGFGNSGGEIALDLQESGAEVGLSIRGAVNVIPRELFGLPILKVSGLLRQLPCQLADLIGAPLLRVSTGDLRRHGIRKLPYGPLTQIRREGRIPLIDVGTVRRIRQGRIAVYPGVERFTEQGVVFKNGNAVRFDAVILATGYRPNVLSLLPEGAAVIGPDGVPLSEQPERQLPGLYFCGFNVSPLGMLRQIGREARAISARIKQLAG